MAESTEPHGGPRPGGESFHQSDRPVGGAARYRGSPRFLIGPDLYPHWARTTRLVASIVVPLVAAGSLVAGIMADEGALEVAASTLWAALLAFVSATFWCTFGFAVAERTGQRGDARPWVPEDRAPVPAPSRPGLGETIGSVVVALGSAALLIAQRVWGATDGDGVTEPLVHPDAWDGRAQAVIAALVAGAVVAVLAHLRGWTTPIALANLAGNLVVAMVVLWLATSDELINPRFFDALGTTERADLAELSGWVTAIIVIVVATVDSVESINGWRRRRGDVLN